MSVITIRGQLGSGTSEIGKRIAQKLNFDYVDQEIIASVAERLRTSSHIIAEKEMPPSTLLGRIAEVIRSSHAFDSGYMDMSLPMFEIPLNDKNYLSGLKYVIEQMAKCQSIVIRGRGGQFILKDFPGAFHVQIVAPLEARVKSVMDSMKIDEQAARDEIKRFDNGIREFVKRYFHAEVENPVYYDLVINTGHLSVEAAASMVVNTMPFKIKTI
jgi:cytidylate kinase